MVAHVVVFALDDLRALPGSRPQAGADPRHDSSPFRAFRSELLQAWAAAARAEAELTMWWEGGFNGYGLAVAVEPAGSVPGLEEAAARACPVESSRLSLPRADRRPLGRVGPGWSEVARDPDGAAFVALFGAPSGHFAAPGMRRER